MDDTGRDDRVLPTTRLGAVILVAAATSAFVVLYLWPHDTARLFAWDIQPPLTALVIAAGYGAGAYLGVRALVARRWHRVGLAFVPVAAFAAPILLATVLHWDRFNHGHPWAYAWAVVYAILPFLFPVLWYLNRRADPGEPEDGDVIVPTLVRWVLVAAGVYAVAVGLFLVALPQVAMAVWPWSLTPLTSRVLGGFYMLSGTGSIVLSLEPRWSGWRHLAEASFLWSALLLVGLARGWDDVEASNPLAWVYVATVVLSLLGIAALYLVLESRRRREPSGGMRAARSRAPG